MNLAGVRKYFKEVQLEFKKITWPTRKELTGSTIVVIIALVIIAFILGIFDFSLSRIMSILLKA